MQMDKVLSQLPLKQTCSGPATTVCLREVSALEGDEVTRHRDSFLNTITETSYKIKMHASSRASYELQIGTVLYFNATVP